jgi:hypothetical protein
MKKILLTAISAFAMFGAMAQDFTLTGNVTQSGAPLSGHMVYISTDTLSGAPGAGYFGTAYTDASGNYMVIIPNGAQTGPNLDIFVTSDTCGGNYQTVTVQNNQGTVSAATVDFVVCTGGGGTVGGPCVSSFSVQDSAQTGVMYFFADNTNANITYTWNYGDGSTSTSSNWWDYHYYSVPGWYQVCLTIDSAGVCTSTTCDSVYVVVSNPGCVADFWWFADSTNNAVYLVNNSSYNPNIVYTWDFGDGNTGTGQYPTHTYASYGTYNVCLTISDGQGCQDQFCGAITFSPVMGGNERAGFTLNVVAPIAAGVEEESTLSDMNVYPNPANENLNISINSMVNSNANVVVTDMLGKVVLNVPANLIAGEFNLNINVASLDAGFYTVSVRDAKNGSVQSVRFIKQ